MLMWSRNQYGPRRSPEGCRDPRSDSMGEPRAVCTGLARILLRPCAGRDRWCRHKRVQHSQNPALPPDAVAAFDSELGLTFAELGPDGARAQLQVQDKLLQPMGIVHGGVYCSIVESLASLSAYLWLNGKDGNGGNVVGVNNNTDFLRAISSGTVSAVSTPLHRGRRQQLWLVTITDDRDRVVARGQVRLQNLEG